MSDIWQANTAYNKGDIVRPTTANDCIYKCIVAGTSGSSEPSWPTTPLEQVADNAVTWLCLKKHTEDDVLLAAMNHIKNNATAMSVCEDNPGNYYQACNPSEWQANTAYNEGDVVRPVGTRNGFVYKCTTPGTSGANEPTWPTTEDETVEDGSVVWTAVKSFALCTTDVSPADFTIDLGEYGGKKIVVAEKDNILIYKTGVGKAVAILDDNNKQLLLVTIPSIQQNFQEGAQAKITSFEYEIEQPGE